MPSELSEIERMTLSAIAAFPIAIFEGPVVDRLIVKGLASIVDTELRVTEAGRQMLMRSEPFPAGDELERAPRGSGRRNDPQPNRDRAKTARRA